MLLTCLSFVQSILCEYSVNEPWRFVYSIADELWTELQFVRSKFVPHTPEKLLVKPLEPVKSVKSLLRCICTMPAFCTTGCMNSTCLIYKWPLHFTTRCTTGCNKKLSYRRETARCVVSIELLPIATQQCRNYLYDKSWPNRWYEVGDLVGGNAW